MDDRARRYELIDSIMRRSVETYRLATGSLEGKAKATLTVGTIVLGIVMGGLGTVAGLTGMTALTGWQFLESLPPRAALLIAVCFIASLVAIFLSVVLAVRALKVVRIRGFGNAATFMGDRTDGVDRERVVKWVSATTDKVYGRIYDACVIELKSLEDQCDRMGKYTRQSQWSLVVGLALSLLWASAIVGAGVVSQFSPSP